MGEAVWRRLEPDLVPWQVVGRRAGRSHVGNDLVKLVWLPRHRLEQFLHGGGATGIFTFAPSLARTWRKICICDGDHPACSKCKRESEQAGRSSGRSAARSSRPEAVDRLGGCRRARVEPRSRGQTFAGAHVVAGQKVPTGGWSTQGPKLVGDLTGTGSAGRY